MIALPVPIWKASFRLVDTMVTFSSWLGFLALGEWDVVSVKEICGRNENTPYCRSLERMCGHEKDLRD